MVGKMTDGESALVWGEREIPTRLVLKCQAAELAVRLAANDHVRRQEAQDLEIAGQLLGVPDLAVLRFQRFPRTR